MIKEFKKPDLNAPRCRKGAPRIVTNNFLSEFIEKYPQYKDLSLEQISLILNTFHGKLWNHALHNRDGIELPESLGYVFLGTCASAKKYNIDIANSIKHNTKVRHQNFESDNYLAKIFYTNFASKYKFKNRELWTFKATRDFKRAVPEVESGRNIMKYMKAARKNDYFRQIKVSYKVDSSYNEFDLN